MSTTAARTRVVVVSGLSGAGKTTALHTLEDLGYFCVDNLPTMLAPQAVAVCEAGGITRVALGIDVRVRAFIASVRKVVEELEAGGTRDVEVVFLDANDAKLLHRFSESRRPHPLASTGEGAIAVLDGVRIERERLSSLRARADHVIDTTHLSVHELRRAIIAQVGPGSGTAPKMLTRILSFGFKYGTPVDADVVLDVRFLENPYFVPELKQLPGTDRRVEKFVLALPETGVFIDKTRDLLRFIIPQYEREGKSYLTIAIGCTGGRHRSVVVAEALSTLLGDTDVVVLHRDVVRAEMIKNSDDDDERPSRRELL
ncbi:MAG: RNase adapter RapZ, partial [Polyangiaceae bacterium]